MTEEDDYMSDIFLQEATKTEPTDHFISRKRKTGQQKSRKEPAKMKPKKVIEKETRDKGLSTALSSDNKGFRLMAKMGYKSGEGLGKNNTGRVEPVPINLKPSRTGLGREAKDKEILTAIEKARAAAREKNEKVEKLKVKDFRNRRHEYFENEQFRKDLLTSQKACYELDLRNSVEEPEDDYYWPPQEGEEEDEWLDDDVYESNANELTVEEKLIHVTCYLRKKYFYCIWCGIKFDTRTDIDTNCPGDSYAWHNEDDYGDFDEGDS